MRLNSNIFNHFESSPPSARTAFFVMVLAVLSGVLSPGVRAQDDDLYGLPGASTPQVPADTLEAPDAPDTVPATPAVPADTASVARPDTAAAGPSAGADTTVSPVAPPAPAPRARITRETTINPLDQQKGAYRNPKKALFMSLLVPGLGQAYIGQSKFTYARAAFYIGTEITLGVMWYQYTVVKYDRKTRQYRRFADEHWSQGEYEDQAFSASAAETFEALNPRRTSYCDAVVDRESGPTAANLYRGCVNILDPDSAVTPSYQAFKTEYADKPTPEATGAFRETFADPVEFYALIGGYQEFIAGWDDAVNVAYTADSISGTSSRRDEYNRLRKQAQDYSRMQAWFIGGIVINHIASAVDAALTARYNNRVLYEGEARWYDRLNVDGGLAFEAGRPTTRMTARLSF